MTRWVAIFEDNPETDVGWIRKQHAQAHFDYLDNHRDKILLGGGLWVMEVDSRDEAVCLCENDPFFRLGLRKSYTLYVWGKAPCYQTVEL